MRIKLVIIFLLSAFIVNAQNFYTPISPGVYPADIGTYTNLSSVFITNLSGSQKYKVTGTTSGWYLGNVNGTDSLHCIEIWVVGKQNINGGIAIENCSNFKVMAPDSVVLLSGGTNGAIKGHADYIQVSGTISLNGINGGWWIKEDAAQACDYSNPLYYLYPYHQRHIWFTDFRFGNPDGTNAVGGEALYLGSTGSYGRDQVPCLGNQIYKPMWENDIHVYHGNIYNSGRTAWQLSGADSGNNEIMYVNSYNPGRELNSSQGAGGRSGYGTSNKTKFWYDSVFNSYLYNFDIETGLDFEYCYGINAGQWYSTKNPQAIPSSIEYAQLPNSKLIMRYNTMIGGTASEGINYALYGSTNYSTTDSSIICGNNGVQRVLSLPLPYTTACGVIPPVDTGCVNHDTTFYRDSYVTGHFDSVFAFRDTTVYPLLSSVVTTHKDKSYRIVFKYGIPQDSIIRYLVRPAYDSTYICSMCQRVDTTICVPRVKTVGWGAFILDGYNSLTTPAQKTTYAKSTLTVKNLRANYVFGNTWQNQQYIDSGINPIPTINNVSVSTGPHPFPTDVNYIQNYIDSLFKISKPPIAAWLNEPPTIGYWDSTGGGVVAANKYLSTFNPFISVCHANGVKAVDGGLTYPIVYSLADYYTRTGKTDSLAYLKTATGILNFTNSQQKIYWRDFFNTLLPGIKNGNADYVQLHFYGDTLSVPNKLLTVVINYIIQQTGKQIVCFETGTDLSSQSNFNSFFTEWTKQNPAYLLYYLSPASMPVTNEGFFLRLKQIILK